MKPSGDSSVLAFWSVFFLLFLPCRLFAPADTGGGGAPLLCGGTVRMQVGDVAPLDLYANPLSSTVYGPVNNPNAGIAVSPTNSGFAQGFKTFFITATTPGIYALTIPWSVSFPSNTSGSCTYTIIVDPVPGSNGGDGGTNGTAADFPNAGVAGDPLNMFTGEYTDFFDDLLKPGGTMHLALQVYYSSRLNASKMAGALGQNWSHNFETRLAVSGNLANVITWLGQHIRFQKSGPNWVLAGDLSVPFKLIENGFGNFLLLDPRNGWQTVFNSNGWISTIADGKGGALYFNYGFTGNGLLASVSDNLGRTLDFTYNGTKLASVQQSFSFNYFSTVKFGFDTNGVLSTITNVLNQVTSFAYDALYPSLALLTGETRPLGNTPVTQTYDSLGRVLTQSRFGGTWTFAYTNNPAGSNSTATATDPNGHTRRFKHDNLGRLIELTDENNQTAAFGYDSAGRRNTIHDRLGGITAFTYDPSGFPASVTEADGTTTTYSYTPRTVVFSGGFPNSTLRDLTQVTLPDGTTRIYQYDANGNRTSAIDARGKTNRWTYDSYGQRSSATSRNGGVTQYTYDSQENLSSVQTPDGNNTSFYYYDPLQPPTQIVHPDSTSRGYAYDALRRVVTDVDENSAFAQYDYDGNDRRTRATDRRGKATWFGYNSYDQLTTVTNPLGQVIRFFYDTLGRLTSVTNPLGGGTTYTYDSLGRRTAATDPLGRTRGWTYDPEGSIVDAYDALGNHWTYDYDDLARPTRLTKPGGGRMRFEYDSPGRLRSALNELDQPKVFTRDPNGRVTRRQLPNGAAFDDLYDDDGNRTRRTRPLGDHFDFIYDLMDRVTTFTDSLGRVQSFTYDNRSRLSQRIWPSGRTATYTYDPANRLTDESFAYGFDSVIRSYTYDEDGRVLTADNFSAEYDAAGRMATNNGVVTTRDANGRVSSITYAPGKVVIYTYDAAGNPTHVSDWNGGVTTFSYDANNRPKYRLSIPGNVTSFFAYDSNSFRVGVTISNTSLLAAQSVTRDAAGQITGNSSFGPAFLLPALTPSVSSLTYTGGVQITSFQYDADGLLTNDGQYAYGYDASGWLTSISSLTTTQSYTWDGPGNLTSRTVNGVVYNYIWNYSLGRRVLTTETIGGVTRYYVYLPDGALLCCMNADGSDARFFHFDIFGNLRFLTDAAGNVTDTFFLTPFGELISRTGTTSVPWTWHAIQGFLALGGNLFKTPDGFYDAKTQRKLPGLHGSFGADRDSFSIMAGDVTSDILPPVPTIPNINANRTWLEGKDFLPKEYASSKDAVITPDSKSIGFTLGLCAVPVIRSWREMPVTKAPFPITSFFDIFTELSLDGGQTSWEPDPFAANAKLGSTEVVAFVGDNIRTSVFLSNWNLSFFNFFAGDAPPARTFPVETSRRGFSPPASERGEFLTVDENGHVRTRF